MIYTLSLITSKRTELIDITEMISEIIKKSKVKQGYAIIYVGHTTASVIINENYDPSVKEDIITFLNRLIPKNNNYAHQEGNADAHIKSAILGTSQQVLIHNSKIILGRWQGIFFCEFDGPRNREVLVQIISEPPFSRIT